MWNNPITYNDPDGNCPMCIVPIIYAAFELASSAADVHDVVTTVSDPEASTTDKVISVVGAGAGLILPGGGDLAKGADKANDAKKAGKNFDEAREESFKGAGMDDGNVEFSKVDSKTGTVVEFKGEDGAKVGYDGPHKSPGKNHDRQHISYQSAGKRKSGGTKRDNVAYDGPQHPSRSKEKN